MVLFHSQNELTNSNLKSIIPSKHTYIDRMSTLHQNAFYSKSIFKLTCHWDFFLSLCISLLLHLFVVLVFLYLLHFISFVELSRQMSVTISFGWTFFHAHSRLLFCSYSSFTFPLTPTFNFLASVRSISSLSLATIIDSSMQSMVTFDLILFECLMET